MSDFEDARLASKDDIETIIDLARSHRLSVSGARGADFYHQKNAEPLDPVLLVKVIADQMSLLVVGTFSDVVFGFALCTVSQLPDGSLCATLTHFIVDPEIRKVGIGAAIMLFLTKMLREKGCLTLDSVALPGDRETKNFFESFGLKARLLVVHKEL